MEKTLLIADARENANRVSATINSLETEIVIVGLNPSAEYWLTEKDIPHKSFKEYFTVKDYDKLHSELVPTVQNWGNTEINGKTLKEFLTYEDISIWDLVEHRLCYHLLKSFYHLTLIKRIVDTERPTDIVVVGADSLLNDIIKNVTRSYGIGYRTLGSSRKSSPEIKNIFDIPILNLGCCVPKHSVGGKADILVLSFLDKPDIPTVVPVIRELDKELGFQSLFIWVDNEPNTVKRFLDREGVSGKGFEEYLDEKTYKKVSNSVEVIRSRLIQLINYDTLKEKIKYQNITLWNIVADAFKLFISTPKLNTVISYHYTLERIINIESPKLIIIPEDKDIFGRLGALVAKNHRIPTLMLVPNWYSIRKNIPLFGSAIADKIAVMRDASKEYVADCNVEANKIVVTGEPRFDELLRKVKFAGREELCEQLGFSNDKRFIVLTTQGLMSENRLILKTVIDAMKEFPERHLIVKSHPIEDSPEMYKRIVKESGAKNVTVIKKIALWDLINECDLLMTVSSITGLEAMILDKPVVIINLTNLPDEIPYVEYGAAIGVRNSKDIVNAIDSAINNRQVQDRLRKGRERFIKNYLYKTDGKSAQRVVKVIKDMLSTNGD